MTTRPKSVPFGEWLPDIPPLENSGAIVAKNCIPQLKSYRELRSLATFTDALANPALGAFWLQNSDNAIFNFAGDTTALYQLTNNNTEWSDVSQGGSPYTAADNWEFAKFGDLVIAASLTNDPQKFLAGTDSEFSDLGGSPPMASRIAVIRDFVVLGDTIGLSLGSDSGPNFVQWSGFNNAELWTPSRATQSDYQELFGRGGRVQKIVPGEYGVIIQEHSIHRMDYIGPPVVFQFDEVERGRGTPAPNSVVWTGNLVFFYGHDGFYLFNGISSEPIGANRVNQWFSDNADVTSIDTMRGVIDRRNRLVMWSFRSSADLDINNMLIIFNWTANRWSYAEIDTQILAEYVTSGFSIDDAAFGAIYSNNIDGVNQVSFDSTAYLGGSLSLQAFNSSNQSATFDGDPLIAELDTTELIGSNNSRMYVNSVRPMINGTPSTVSTVSVGSRNISSDNITFTNARQVNQIGETNVRVNSRYQRYRVNISGGFSHANGVQAMVREKAGRR
jgi:hypothetical protein